MYKKNPSTPDLHINCNLTSDNMPNIHPETKVLIIKRLKTRSTAEVADTFNVSQRQVQRIRKRYEETGDVFDQPRSGRPCKTTTREDHWLARKSKASPFSTAPQQSSTRPGHLKSPCQPEQFVEFVSKWPPWSNQCPETSTEQKTIKKTCGFCQGPQPAKRLKKRWKSGRRWISQMNLLLNYITVAANIAEDLLEPAWIRDSPRKQSSLVAEKSWSGVTSSMGVCERSAGWKATSIV